MSVDWSARYQSGETPWEKGEPHPELPFLLSEHRELIDAAEQIFVPGCGFGHDAALINSATPGQITALDLAEEAIAEAKIRYSKPGLIWQIGDLFQHRATYDLVFEHTCFCAIPTARREEYAATMARLIPVGGHLLGIFFLNPDHEGEEGPPFGVTIEELHGFFGKDFDLIWSKEPEKTYEARQGEGRELGMLWRRISS